MAAMIGRRNRQSASVNTAKSAIVTSGAISAAAIVGSILHISFPDLRTDPVWQRGQAALPPKLSTPLVSNTSSDWAHYGNDRGGTRFSPLAQINAANVADLKPAWEADVDTGAGVGGTLQVTPPAKS